MDLCLNTPTIDEHAATPNCAIVHAHMTAYKFDTNDASLHISAPVGVHAAAYTCKHDLHVACCSLQKRLKLDYNISIHHRAGAP